MASPTERLDPDWEAAIRRAVDLGRPLTATEGAALLAELKAVREHAGNLRAGLLKASNFVAQSLTGSIPDYSGRRGALVEECRKLVAVTL